MPRSARAIPRCRWVAATASLSTQISSASIRNAPADDEITVDRDDEIVGHEPLTLRDGRPPRLDRGRQPVVELGESRLEHLERVELFLRQPDRADLDPRGLLRLRGLGRVLHPKDPGGVPRGEAGGTEHRAHVGAPVIDRLTEAVVAPGSCTVDRPSAQRRAHAASARVRGNVDPYVARALEERPGHDPVAVEDSDPVGVGIEPLDRRVREQVGSLPHQLSAVDELARVDHRDRVVDVVERERSGREALGKVHAVCHPGHRSGATAPGNVCTTSRVARTSSKSS